jgi:arylsulfatase A-like enzyme
MTAERDQPNVLLLLTDQERFDVLDEAGPAVETPALDRLCRDGTRFDSAYTPISICSAARASILSGLYPHNHGMLNNCHEADAIQPNLSSDVVTFGEVLQQAGYTNTYLGKWHVGRDQGPSDFGFEYLGGSDRHHDEALESRFRDYQKELGVDPDADHLSETISTAGTRNPTLVAATTDVPPEATRAYYLAERTIERLAAVDESTEPFFHRTDFLGPHHPYVVPEPYASMYDPDDLEPWPSARETYAGKPAVQEQYLAYRGVEEFDQDRWSDVLAKYLGFVTLIDDQIGRILDALDDAGLADSTVVVHTSDHGDFVGGHRQFNKGPLMYDDTYRVPLVVRGPDVPAGASRDEFVSLVDLMPTFLDLAGVDVPDHVDGRSVLPLLGGDADDWRTSVFAEYHGDEFGLYSQRMVRTAAYKFVFNGPDVNELYDLTADPHELSNVVDHPGYRSERRRLVRLLLQWMERTDDPLYPWTARHLTR